MSIYCGIDWAENHHDIAIVDDAGTQLAKLRIGDDAAGYAALLALLAVVTREVVDGAPA